MQIATHADALPTPPARICHTTPLAFCGVHRRWPAATTEAHSYLYSAAGLGAMPSCLTNGLAVSGAAGLRRAQAGLRSLRYTTNASACGHTSPAHRERLDRASLCMPVPAEAPLLTLQKDPAGRRGSKRCMLHGTRMQKRCCALGVVCGGAGLSLCSRSGCHTEFHGVLAGTVRACVGRSCVGHPAFDSREVARLAAQRRRVDGLHRRVSEGRVAPGFPEESVPFRYGHVTIHACVHTFIPCCSAVQHTCRKDLNEWTIPEYAHVKEK